MPTGPLTHYVCNSDNALVLGKSKFLQAERQYVAFISKHHHDQNPSCSVTTRFTNIAIKLEHSFPMLSVCPVKLFGNLWDVIITPMTV